METRIIGDCISKTRQISIMTTMDGISHRRLSGIDNGNDCHTYSYDVYEDHYSGMDGKDETASK
jgi:hypothetical protein